MKIKNKKTGEIGYLYEHSLTQDIIIVYDVKGIVGKYASLAELTEEWEDAPEEPKEYWAIDIYSKGAEDFKNSNDDVDKFNKEIGNYFETKEEAEKAVEKLKAWKRLKDEYDFKFTGWKRDEQFRGDFIITAQDWNTSDDKLLNLLFGGEE